MIFKQNEVWVIFQLCWSETCMCTATRN